MAFCFCLLLTQIMAQFHWPLCENMQKGIQKPECALDLDMWVNDRNGINGIDVSDHDWPECDSNTCGYKTLQCKIGSNINLKYCRCVNPKDNTNLKLFRPYKRHPLDITYKNFPILFKMEKFNCDWFLRRDPADFKNGRRVPGVLPIPYPVPLHLGMVCDQDFTHNKYCINKISGKCQVFPSNCDEKSSSYDKQKCSCIVEKDRCKHEKCEKWEKSLLNHLRTLRKIHRDQRRRK